MSARYFGYLDGLRETGITSLFTIERNLAEEFGLEFHKARDIVIAWAQERKNPGMGG